MKKFKFLSIICLTMLACFMFVGCGIGSYDLQFILPDGTVHTKVTYGPSSPNLKSYVSAPSVFGYNFVGWSETQDLEYVIKIPYEIRTSKLYAKYEINQDMFYSHSTIDYYGSSATLNVTQTYQNYYLILIKNNSSTNFTKINVYANNSDFTINKLSLRNSNAKLIQDNDSSLNMYTISEATNQSEFVLEVNAINNGDFTIVVE